MFRIQVQIFCQSCGCIYSLLLHHHLKSFLDWGKFFLQSLYFQSVTPLSFFSQVWFVLLSVQTACVQFDTWCNTVLSFVSATREQLKALDLMHQISLLIQIGQNRLHWYCMEIWLQMAISMCLLVLLTLDREWQKISSRFIEGLLPIVEHYYCYDPSIDFHHGNLSFTCSLLISFIFGLPYRMQ